MNGHFEQSGTYPFSTQPAKGYGAENPTPDTIVIHIGHRDKAVKFGEGDAWEFVDIPEATIFPDVVAGVRAASKLSELVRAK